MGTTTDTVTERLVDAMRRADWDAITDTYAPDVLLDMNLPSWRFQLQGRDAVRAWFAEELPKYPNLRTTALELHRGESSLILEAEMRFDGDDGEHLWRAVDLFRLDGDAVVEHVEYSTGPWSPDEIARQRAEAPMVRW